MVITHKGEPFIVPDNWLAEHDDIVNNSLHF